MDNSKYSKRVGRAGEWGKLSKGYRKGANKRTRAAAKKEIRNA